MKKLLIAIGIFIIILVVTAAIFILTFDINKYKPVVESQLGTALGNTVKIEKLFLSWKGSLAVGMDGLTVFEQGKSANEPSLAVGRAEVAINLLPLLNKQISIISISIKDLKAHIIHMPSGEIRVEGVNPQPSGPSKPAESKAALPLVFSVDKMELLNGVVRYEDKIMNPPVDITLSRIDATVRDVALDKPLRFDVKAAILSSSQNLSAGGIFSGISGNTQTLKDFKAQFDIATVDYDQLVKSIPAVTASGIQRGFQGKALVEVRNLSMKAGKIESLDTDIGFTGGKLVLSQIKIPIEDINLNAHATEKDLVLSGVSARALNARFKGEAKVSDYAGTPATSLKTSIDVDGLNSFITQLSTQKNYIDGKLALSLDATATGKTPEDIKKSISGTGSFTLDNGILLNMNIIKQSLGNLTMFPGLIDTLTSALPADMQAYLKEEHTVLQPVKQSFTINNGLVKFDDMALSTLAGDIKGRAQADFGGQLSGSGIIRFNKAISDGLTGAVKELKYLEGQDGLVEFPIEFKAGPQGSMVMPDLKYIASKVAMAKGGEVVSDLLGKLTTPQKEGAAAEAGKSPSSGSALDNVMNTVKSYSSGASTQQATASAPVEASKSTSSGSTLDNIMNIVKSAEGTKEEGQTAPAKQVVRMGCLPWQQIA